MNLHRLGPVLAWLCLIASLASAGEHVLRPTINHVERLAWVVDWRPDANSSAPLVVALHGFRQVDQALAFRENPARLEWSRLADLAHSEGFIAIFPAAYQGRWNMFDGLDNTADPSGEPVDDEAFILDLVSDFVAKGHADRDRVFLTGISDGAIMTYRMACLPDTPFAAVAPLIGTAYGDHLDACAPAPPPALLHVHGTHDAVLPYDGWLFAGGREASVPEAMEHWRKLHGCTGQEGRILDDLDPTDGSTVGEMIWTGCDTDEPVKRYKVINGGHAVPRRDIPQNEDPNDRFNRDIDALTLVWAFFSTKER